MAKQSIYKFENVVITPSSETLLKISDAPDVSYLFFYENPVNYNLRFQNVKFREKHKIDNQQLEKEIKEMFAGISQSSQNYQPSRMMTGNLRTR